MKNLFITLTALVVLLAIPSDARPFVVKMSGDTLSVHAERVPLQDILHRLAELGIKVQISPRINPDVSTSFENRKIQRGLETITRPYSLALIWESPQVPTGGTVRLAEIQVYETGKRALIKPLEEGAVFTIVVDPKDGSLFVANEILLKPGPGMDLATFEALLRKIGGRVIGHHRVSGVYRIRLERQTDVPALARALSRHPGIADTEPNYAYRVASPYKNVTAVAMADVSAGTVDTTGGVTIAVLDTGLSQDSGLGDLVAASFNSLSPNQTISDSLGHGTQMALVASGAVQPYGTGADTGNRNAVIPIRVFDDNGFTSTFNIAQSVEFALRNGARVMSLSWGSETRSDVLEGVFDSAREKGLIITASAGNKPTGAPVYPAAYRSVIGVGALAPDGETWKESNFGSFVKVYAPGFANMPVGYKGDPGVYAGTSISTAYTANVIAQYLTQHPDASLAEIFDALKGE